MATKTQLDKVRQAVRDILDARFARFDQDLPYLGAMDERTFEEAISFVALHHRDRDGKWAAGVVAGFVRRYREGKI